MGPANAAKLVLILTVAGPGAHVLPHTLLARGVYGRIGGATFSYVCIFARGACCASHLPFGTFLFKLVAFYFVATLAMQRPTVSLMKQIGVHQFAVNECVSE